MKYFIIYFICFLFIKNYLISAEKSEIKHNEVNKEIKRYEPNWNSINSRPLPGWYDESKIGIFIHWGVYSAVGYGSEWVYYSLKKNKTSEFLFMQKFYKQGFTYQEFGPMLTAEFFNPDRWVEIIKDSGAKYVILTSKHHDGFTMWPSSYSFSWNSVDVGPHRDIVGEFSASIRKNSELKLGLYYSLFEWHHPIYLQDKLNFFKTDNYVTTKVQPELKELINNYKPDILWSDGDVGFPAYWKSLEFLSWLYNDSPVNSTVMTNDRWGFLTHCKHGGVRTCTDKYNLHVLQPFKWENALSIDKQSWGYRLDATLEQFFTVKELINELVTTISCGGNILINISPDKFGVIQLVYVERLNDMGKWLQINGEAIYKSRPFKYQNDTKTPDVWYTENISENGKYVYAILLEYPKNQQNLIQLYSVHGLVDEKSKIYLLGYPDELSFIVYENHIIVSLPQKQFLDDIPGLNWAWTLKLVLS